MAKHEEKPTQEYYPWPYDASFYDKAYSAGDQKVKRQVEISIDWIGEINSGVFRNWDELKFLKQHWDGPLVVKGIQSIDVCHASYLYLLTNFVIGCGESFAVGC